MKTRIITVAQLMHSLGQTQDKNRPVALCLTEHPLLAVVGVLDTEQADDCVELVLSDEAEHELTQCPTEETVARRCSNRFLSTSSS